MRKYIVGAVFLLYTAAGLSGCAAVGTKTASLSIIYGAAAVVSLLLLIGCCSYVRKRKIWFILLFTSVLVVNVGYTLLSVSTCLEMALWANRIAYLGSVFLPMLMMMIVLNVTNTAYPRWLRYALGILAAVVFAIAASPGILDIYYQEVSFAVVDGVSTLIKVYGPLHPIYLVYLLGYFTAMVTVIVRATVRKTIDSTAHAGILAIAVLVNLCVWFIEQLTDINFEFLSVSYIISELFLLGIHMVVNENQQLKEMVQQKEDALKTVMVAQKQWQVCDVTPEQMECYTAGLPTLTATERIIYNAYLAGTTTKQIMKDMNITENTLKFHNKNIYSKLGVSSRKQLLSVHKAINESE